jgi:hypothetical protein
MEKVEKTPLELPQPEEKLLRAPNFFEKYAWLKPISILSILIATIILSTYLLQTNNPTPDIIPITPSPTAAIITPKISCRPRPACLDSIPRCMIPETSDMCPKTTPTSSMIACPADAKQCSDGTWVGRTGPSCEFVCPLSQLNEVEKNLIEAWITKNQLNIYGDPKNTMYTGGTPLFNEATGQKKDRFEYILEKHPDRPWNKF